MRRAFFIIILILLSVCSFVYAEQISTQTKTQEGVISTTEIMQMIVRSYSQLNPEDPAFWEHLEKKEEWGHAEDVLLIAMIRGALAKRNMPLIERFEKLADSDKFGRKPVIGGALAEVGMPDRAIPILEKALQENKNTEYRTGVAYTLFQACLAAGKWQKAEIVFEDVKSALDAKSIQDQMGIIALVAAKAGALDDAMRLWRRRAAFDAGDLRGLDDLAKAGLRGHLQKYYRDLKKNEPHNKIADKALDILE